MTDFLSWGPDGLIPVIALLGGLWVLILSSDLFVEGAVGVANHMGISPIVIGMVIVGFGTSAPEMIVSTFSAIEGKPSLALGNAFGSNIANIGLILGITAIIQPILVHSNILRRELPLLTGLTVFSFLLLMDGFLSRVDGFLLLISFICALGWTVWISYKRPHDAIIQTVAGDVTEIKVPLSKSLGRLIIGLALLITSSRILVWGAVELALMAGISELIIGLTVVAIGTSLPELASTIAAVRKGQHDLAIGNVVGSNMFNTMAVVGIASSIAPFSLDNEILTLHFPVMAVLTLSLFVIGWGRKGSGRVNRVEGAGLLISFVAYTIFIALSVLPS